MKICSFFLFICLTTVGYSQTIDSSFQKMKELSGNYFSKVDKKITSLDDDLTKKTAKYLAKLERQEKQMQAKLQKLNPESNRLFTDSKEKYEQFSKKLKDRSVKFNKLTGGQYIGRLDSLGTSLSFLKQFKDISGKVTKPLQDLNNLQDKLQQTEKIKQYIADKRKQIKELLSTYTKVPKSLQKQYERFSKTALYYSQQLQEYKEILKNPAKIEKKALGLLNKLPAFQKFFKENSQLASLFRLPGGENGASNLTGLQTRVSVGDLIQQQISIGGPNAQAQIQQNLAMAHSELNKLKDKINKYGGSGGDVDMPDFSPNKQKTKPFLKRFTYTSDFQFGKSNSLVPNGADIGLGIGYNFSDKIIAGTGIAYKLGIGNISHIRFSHLGMGVRSYLDIKLKNQFFANGGFEMNYNAQFRNIDQLKNYNAWQRSGLLGISKKYKVSNKLKGQILLLYDFLSYSHTPVSQPFIFRTGFSIK